VWGVVYRVDASDLKALDTYEGVAEGMYHRTAVVVQAGPAGSSVMALTYAAVRGFNDPARPSRRYRDVLVRGAEHHRLPHDYAVALRQVPTLD
jgi:hypothetical protein